MVRDRCGTPRRADREDGHGQAQRVESESGVTHTHGLTSPLRYTFGSALFVGWVAGGLTLIGGVMMCIACRGLVPEETT